MPAQRTPGPLGLDTDPFPAPNRPWEEWPGSPALPAGPAADAHYEAGPVGLDDVLPGADQEDAESESPGPIERFRYMEVQGEMYKVRCTPLWQGRMLGMLGAAEDEKGQDKLIRVVKSHKPETRASMVSFLTQQLSAEGKGGSPIAGKLAQIKLPQVDEGGPGEGGLNGRAGVAGRMANALPAVQRGRRTVNG